MHFALPVIQKFVLTAAVAIACVAISYTFQLNAAEPTAPAVEKPVSANGELFTPIASVLRQPRCMNCHPRDDRPRQGDDRHKHLQNVTRGPDDMGFVNLRCNSCHRDENNEHSGVPGAPTWHLAPLSQGWQGLTDADLCTTLKDQSKNGGKDMAKLVDHMTNDKLVLWGWEPGADRVPITPPHPEFVTQLNAWAKAGAPCPVAQTSR